MEQKYTRWGKFRNFMKRNVYYVLLFVCLAVIGTLIAVSIGGNDDSVDVGVKPTVSPTPTPTPTPTIAAPTPTPTPTPTKIVFCHPVENAVICFDYSMDELVWWNALEKWSVHDGIDYKAAIGTNVVAVYGGRILSVEYDVYEGTVVRIDHGGGLITKYAGLSEDLNIATGDTVKKGDVIGTIGAPGLKEFSDGPHIHFSTELHNEVVNPYDYFEDTNK